MSVEIYNVDDTACLLCIGVAGEHTFQTIWEKAIVDCHLQYIGNGVWLYRKDLQKILQEFDIVEQYMMANNAWYMVQKIEYILQELPKQWKSHMQRLWMG